MARRIRGARPLFGLHDHEIIVDLFAGGVVGQPLDRGVGTVTGVDHHSLVLAHVTKFRTGAVGHGLEAMAAAARKALEVERHG